jgi:Glycosyl hydrolase family 26
VPRAPARRFRRLVVAATVLACVAAIAAGAYWYTGHSRDGHRTAPSAHLVTALPTTPDSYLGVYASGVPLSYAGVASFTKATEVQPDLALYYSGWFEPFQASFALKAAEHHAVPLVQINPTGISVAAIASGRYDQYLDSYARAVRSFGRAVIIGFGHEMNASWYSWGDTHTSPATFVAAWRHIVQVFRAAGARNVTWLWTINIDRKPNGLQDLGSWWPGRHYVTWVGIDGYYLKPTMEFAQVFGPTILAVRALTKDPILISETAAVPSAGQSAKIADLFAGVRTYGLLGFVWFDSSSNRDFRIASPEAAAAFQRAAKRYRIHAF